MAQDIALSLGSNVGDRQGFLGKMHEALGQELCRPYRYSRVMETAPVGVGPEHGNYLNQVLCARFRGTPQELLETCLGIEKDLGRIRTAAVSPRTADIDILLFGNEIIDDENLTIPHPELLNRRFCIEGLAELLPDTLLPGSDTTFSELAQRMNAELKAQIVYFLGNE